MHENFSKEDERTPQQGCCCKKSGMEVCLCLSLILVITSIPIGISYFGLEIAANYCLEPECVHSSAEILNFLNTSLDPCTNFEEFVCGNFKRQVYETHIDNVVNYQVEKINNRLDGFIVQPIDEAEDSEAVQIQKQFFQACLNVEDIDRDRDRTFFHLIDLIGGWPLLMHLSWVETKFNWQQVIIKCQQIGMPFHWYMDFDVERDVGEKYLLKLSVPKLCGSELNNHEYVNMMANIVMNLTGNDYTFSEMSKVVSFQQQLAELCELHKNDKPLRRYVRDLHQLVPSGKWIDFLSVLTGRKWRLPSNTRIIYNIKHYLPKLDHLLRETPQSVQANYIVWKMIEYYAPYLSKPIRETHLEYIKTSDEQQTRFQFCLEQTKAKFPCLNQMEYVKKYTLVETQEKISEIIDLLREEFAEYVSTAPWADEELKNNSMEWYRENIEKVIGASNLDDDSLAQKHTQKLKFRTNNVIDMVTEIAQRDSAALFDKIGRTDDEFQEYCVENVGIELEFNSEENSIFVPSGLLSDFFYSASRPAYLNFASLGTLLATKLTNFDLINENGTETFEQCLVDDLDVKEQQVKDVAQVMFGRDIAYIAYGKWVEQNGVYDGALLPGLDAFTANQLFWIKSSMSYCYRHLITEESEEVEDKSAFDKNKFIQSLKHSKFFGNDFQCEDNTEMNPEEKCAY